MQGEGKETAGIYLISHNYLPHTQQIQGAVMTISTTLTYTTFYIQNIYIEREIRKKQRGGPREIIILLVGGKSIQRMAYERERI